MTNIHVPSQLNQLSKKELLEYAHIMHKENIVMAAEVGRLKAELESKLALLEDIRKVVYD